MLICLFGLLCKVNNRLSGVSFSLSCNSLFVKYFLRSLTDSSAMKLGCLPNLFFSISCGMSILHGIGVSGSLIFSRCLILSCRIVLGLSPDCLIIV